MNGYGLHDVAQDRVQDVGSCKRGDELSGVKKICGIFFID